MLSTSFIIDDVNLDHQAKVVFVFSLWGSPAPSFHNLLFGNKSLSTLLGGRVASTSIIWNSFAKKFVSFLPIYLFTYSKFIHFSMHSQIFLTLHFVAQIVSILAIEKFFMLAPVPLHHSFLSTSLLSDTLSHFMLILHTPYQSRVSHFTMAVLFL